MAKKPGKISKIEAAKEAALAAHLRGALAAAAPATAEPQKRKRKPGPKNSLPVEHTGVEFPQKLPSAAPRVRAYGYFALGYSMSSIARALDVGYDTVRDWRDKDGWVARRDASTIEADTHRAVQIGTLKDKGFVASNRILDHVVDALDAVDVESGLPRSYEAEELRDLATAVEKVIKPAYPNQNGVQVGVQVNLAEALEESRKLDYVKIVEAEP
jgi:Putative ATPase subunit of terminase (gpP-like)